MLAHEAAYGLCTCEDFQHINSWELNFQKEAFSPLNFLLIQKNYF